MSTDPTGPKPRSGASIIERVPLSPVGSRRIEHTLAVMMSVFGALFSLQSVPAAVHQWPVLNSPLGLLSVVLVYGAILLSALAAALHQWTRQIFLASGAAFLGALTLWPEAATGPVGPGEMPWLLTISGVFCGFVIIAMSKWIVPLAYCLLVAGVFGYLRTTPAGGMSTLGVAVLDALYALALSLALLTIVVAIRSAARSVDRAQGTALGRYADAQIDEATESERVRTDALVHDSVLTTFLSAASSHSEASRELAGRMAQNAMNVLSRATVASHTGPKVPLVDLLGRARADSDGIGGFFEFSAEGVRGQLVPEPVADALVSAVVQAMTNSVKHAGDASVPRSVTVRGTESGAVQVVVSDRGRGFDPSGIASERLGVRVSILERMRRVGGEADLQTALGEGTTIVLSWPEPVRNPTSTTDAERIAVA
jgi:signal transduction histidine kinase